MKFVCERCHTKYSIADEKVRGKVLKVRCKTCANVITVRETGATIDDEASASNGPREAAQSLSGSIDAGTTGGDGDTVVSPRAALLGHVATKGAGKLGARGAGARGSLPEEALFAPSAPVAAPPPKRAAPPPPPPVSDVEWYLAVDGAQTGPFSRARLIDKIIATPRDADIHVWNADLDGWKPPADVGEVRTELARRRSATPPVPPPAARRPTGTGMPIAAAGAAAEGGLLSIDSDAHAGQHSATGHKKNGIGGAGLAAAAVATAMPSADMLSGDAFGDLLGNETPAPGAAAATAARLAAAMDPAVVLTSGPVSSQMSGAISAGAPTGKGKQVRLLLGALGVVVVLCGIVSVWMFRRPAVGATATEPVVAKATTNDFNDLANKLKQEQEAEKAAVKEVPAPEVVPEKPPIVARQDPPPRTKGKQPRRRNLTSPPPVSTSGGLTAEQKDAANRFGQSTGRDVRVAQTATGGARSTPAQADISRVINSNKMGIQTCYQRALLRDNTLTNGKVTVRVSIGLSGKVKSVNLDAPAQFRALEPCIREVMSRWAFPPSSEEYGTEFPVVLAGNQ